MTKAKGRAFKQSLSPTVKTQTVNGGTTLVSASVLAQEPRQFHLGGHVRQFDNGLH